MLTKSGARRLLTYALILSAVAILGFPILRGLGVFRKTVTLETDFQTSPLTSVKMVTVLPKDGIRAIKDPQFITADEGLDQMRVKEQVIGVSLNGDHRAYPLNVLSVHEVVDDVVGGVPVAVTY